MKIYSEKYLDKLYERINEQRKKLSEEYNVSENAIVWIGNNHFIICKNEQTIRIWKQKL